MLIQFFCLIKDEGVCNFVTSTEDYLIWAGILQRSDDVLEFKVMDYGTPLQKRSECYSKWVTELHRS